jgi:murein DD-endopeptidase MepM/ murein hydrolase activator NlpD
MRPPLDRMTIRRFVNEKDIKPLHNVFGGHLRFNPKAKPGKQWNCHQGWDLEAKDGTPIHAVSEGFIVEVGYRPQDYGHYVTLEFVHAGKRRYATYAHLSMCFPHRLETGKRVHVVEGTVLGKTGHSGMAHSLPPIEHHLHFEIREMQDFQRGLPRHINPKFFLGEPPYSGPSIDL